MIFALGARHAGHPAQGPGGGKVFALDQRHPAKLGSSRAITIIEEAP